MIKLIFKMYLNMLLLLNIILYFRVYAISNIKPISLSYHPDVSNIHFNIKLNDIPNNFHRSYVNDSIIHLSERRVMKLINKINESITNDEFFAPLWETLKYEADTSSEDDLKASTLLTNAILSQPTFEDAIIDYVSNQLETPLFQATQIRNIFAEVVQLNSSITYAWALDLISTAMRDNTLPNTVGVFLFNKGFHALVTYRIANSLWQDGRDGLARYFQSLASRIFNSDIHPACSIGQGCYLSGASGIVIGETASIGNNCCISHDVTLGGTGKDSGDRHPKVGNGVLIAAGATVLGNIPIGDGSVINAGSVVTKPVEPHTRVGGVPAKLITRFLNQNSISDLNDISEIKYADDDINIIDIKIN